MYTDIKISYFYSRYGVIFLNYILLYRWSQFLVKIKLLCLIMAFKGIQAVRIDFFYIKSCQYSMFYTNKMF